MAESMTWDTVDEEYKTPDAYAVACELIDRENGFLNSTFPMSLKSFDWEMPWKGETDCCRKNRQSSSAPRRSPGRHVNSQNANMGETIPRRNYESSEVIFQLLKLDTAAAQLPGSFMPFFNPSFLSLKV
jgi:hypothetical protein